MEIAKQWGWGRGSPLFLSHGCGEGNLFPFSLSPKKATDEILQEQLPRSPKSSRRRGWTYKDQEGGSWKQEGSEVRQAEVEADGCGGEARDRYLPRKVKKKVNDVVPSPLQLQDDDTSELISRERGSAFREQVTVWTQGALYIFLSC